MIVSIGFIRYLTFGLLFLIRELSNLKHVSLIVMIISTCKILYNIFNYRRVVGSVNILLYTKRKLARLQLLSHDVNIYICACISVSFTFKRDLNTFQHYLRLFTARWRRLLLFSVRSPTVFLQSMRTLCTCVCA